MASTARGVSPAQEAEFLNAVVRGGELLASGQLDEARTLLEQAQQMDPRHEKALNLLGLTYFKLGVFDRAAQVYEALVNENPADATLRVNLGLVYLKSNDVQRSVKEFETATDLDPEHKKAHNYLGLALAQAGDYGKAREHFVAAGSDAMAEKMARALATRAAEAPKAPEPPPPPPEPPSAPPAHVADAAAPVPLPGATSAVAQPEPIDVMSDEPPPELQEDQAEIAVDHPSAPPGPIASDWGTQLAPPPASAPDVVEGQVVEAEVQGEPPLIEGTVTGETVVPTEAWAQAGAAGAEVAAAAAAWQQPPPPPPDAAVVEGTPPAEGWNQQAEAAAVGGGWEQPAEPPPAPAESGWLAAPDAPPDPYAPGQGLTQSETSMYTNPYADPAVGAAAPAEAAAGGGEPAWLAQPLGDVTLTQQHHAPVAGVEDAPPMMVTYGDGAPPGEGGAVVEATVEAEPAPEVVPNAESVVQPEALLTSTSAVLVVDGSGEPTGAEVEVSPHAEAAMVEAPPPEGLPAAPGADELDFGGVAPTDAPAGEQAEPPPPSPSQPVEAQLIEASAEAPVEAMPEAPIDAVAEPAVEAPSLEAMAAAEMTYAPHGAPRTPEPAPQPPAIEPLAEPARAPAEAAPPSQGFAPMGAPRLMELGESTQWVAEPTAGPFHISPDGLAVSVAGEMLTRMTNLVAIVGSIDAQPENRRARGRTLEQPFGQGASQLQRVKGNGVLYLEVGRSRFHAFDLDDEAAYLREERLFAFEEPISFENGRLSADGGHHLDLVHLKGRGRVLLQLDGNLKAMPIPTGNPMVVPLPRVVGWFGHVNPRLKAFAGQAAVELTGEGYVLLGAAAEK